MASTPAPAETTLQFAKAAQWAAWLRRHHAKSTGVWLCIAKKGADDTSVTYPEALEVALCFGWIDALKKNDGPQHWVQRFTPRAKRSIWSKVNREKALKLVELGRMQPAGLAEMQRAQADGRWQAAYDPQSASTVPPDLQAAFDAQPAVQAFFETLDSKNRYAVLFRLQTAKLAATRARRIETFVAMLARGEKLHP
ncbi:MAG: YdeI/OmpD-associated family protein [Burkholderiaceae bacterium]